MRPSRSQALFILLNFGVTVEWFREQGLLQLPAIEVPLLRARRLAISVVWGLSTAAVAAGIVAEVHWVICDRSSTADLAALAALASR